MTAGIGPGRLGQVYYLVFAEPTEKAGDRHAATEAHLAYLAGIKASGHLFLAGPMVDENGRSTGAGFFIVRASSLAEAETMARRDPYHTGGFRTCRVAPWRLDQGGFELSVDFARGAMSFT